VIIYPTPVQGKGAAVLIAKAIHTASQRAEVDTLIICRGGGSIEDLWQFNEEVVARAIDDCPIPTISGVGHETDFTICDFVADTRSVTPTAAAEMACADIRVLQSQLSNLQNRLNKQINFLLNQTAQKLDFLARRLFSPQQQIENRAMQIKQLQHRLSLAMQQNLQVNQHILLRLASSIEQLNPKSVLARGYAIVHGEISHNDLLNTLQQQLITDAQQIQPETRLNITFYKGSAAAKVISTEN
jgi:exodeoxyribonuclease VII large subunit